MTRQRLAATGAAPNEESLVEAHFDLVHSIAISLSNRVPNADLDELVGDGLVGLLVAIRAWDSNPAISLTPWAVTIVRRAMIDGVRSARGRRWRAQPASLDREIGDGDTAVDLLADEETNVEEIVVARDLTRRVLALEPRRRFVLLARYRGLMDRETAYLLGVSTTRVETLIRDARRKLAA